MTGESEERGRAYADGDVVQPERSLTTGARSGSAEVGLVRRLVLRDCEKEEEESGSIKEAAERKSDVQRTSR
jgi:predicted glycosyl hydrolase (DUF1957 family)